MFSFKVRAITWTKQQNDPYENNQHITPFSYNIRVQKATIYSAFVFLVLKQHSYITHSIFKMALIYQLSVC